MKIHSINGLAVMAALSVAGGGEVVVPEGVFRTGGLDLKSGVTLRLLDGAPPHIGEVGYGSGEMIRSTRHQVNGVMI